jgi:hypothetical protein
VQLICRTIQSEFNEERGGHWRALRNQNFRAAPCMGQEDGVVKPCLGSGWRLRSAWIVGTACLDFRRKLNSGWFASVVIAEVKSTAISRRRMSHGRSTMKYYIGE